MVAGVDVIRMIIAAIKAGGLMLLIVYRKEVVSSKIGDPFSRI